MGSAKSTLEILEDYERAGWLVLALPPDIAEIVVGQPATQQRALALSERLRRVLAE